jgi:hypothetical protein
MVMTMAKATSMTINHTHFHNNGLAAAGKANRSTDKITASPPTNVKYYYARESRMNQ